MPVPTTSPASSTQRMAAEARPERIADPDDVPAAGGVAPRRAVVLGTTGSSAAARPASPKAAA